MRGVSKGPRATLKKAYPSKELLCQRRQSLEIDTGKKCKVEDEETLDFCRRDNLEKDCTY